MTLLRGGTGRVCCHSSRSPRTTTGATGATTRTESRAATGAATRTASRAATGAATRTASRAATGAATRATTGAKRALVAPTMAGAVHCKLGKGSCSMIVSYMGWSHRIRWEGGRGGCILYRTFTKKLNRYHILVCRAGFSSSMDLRITEYLMGLSHELDWTFYDING